MIRLARQNTIAAFDDGTTAGVTIVIDTTGGIADATTHPGFLYMQDGNDGEDDFAHFALPGDGENVVMKFESFGFVDGNQPLLYLILSDQTTGNSPIGDNRILWLHQNATASAVTLTHNIRRLNTQGGVDTNDNVNFQNVRPPLWIRVARSGNDWTISYRTRWNASWTDDVTLTNSSISSGHLWIRCVDGNRKLIDWIRSDDVAFVTTSPAASWTGLSGGFDTTNAAVDMLQAEDSDIGLEGDDTVLADGTDRVEFRFNGGSWQSLTAWKALGSITPTSIDIRLISDGTQQIKIANILVGEAATTVPAVPTIDTITAASDVITVNLTTGTAGTTNSVQLRVQGDDTILQTGTVTGTGAVVFNAVGTANFNTWYELTPYAVLGSVNSIPGDPERFFLGNPNDDDPESALYDFIKADATLAANVGTDSEGAVRIYPERAQQGLDLPYITLQPLRRPGEQHQTAATGYQTSTFLIDIWAPTSVKRRSLANDLREVLDGVQQITMGGMVTQSVWVEEETNTIEKREEGGTVSYRASLEINIRHQTTVPTF